MDAEGRERALEARVAELEERLRRVELAQAQAQAGTAAAAAPLAEPPRTADPTGHPPVPTGPGWVLPRPASPPVLPVSPTHASPPPPLPGLPSHAAPMPSQPGPMSAPVAAASTALRPPQRPRVTLAELEARLTGRALAWVGGLAIVLGAIFFLSLAFTRGWIGPEARVIIGLATGSLSLAIGAVFMDRGNRLLGHVLTPVGLAIISISLVGATRLYALIPVEVGLLLALASSIVVAVIAVRADSRIVAAFGLIAVLIAPPLMGASADPITLAFVAVVLVGTTGVALWRSWPWLPSVAFVLSAPQLASWILGDPDPLMGMIGVGSFWFVNLVAAAGEEVRRRRHDISASSTTLMLANAAFLVWAGFALLDGDLSTYRGPFLALAAGVHLAVGVAFVRRDGDADLFGLLTIGTGLAALAMAAPVQFGTPAIPIAWTAEAAALMWVAARRGHPYSAAVAAVLFVLAGGYLVDSFTPALGLLADQPSTNGLAGSAAFFVAGTGVGLWFLRDRSFRFAAAAYATVILIFCALMRLDGVPLAVAVTGLMVIAAALPSILELLPDRPIAWRTTGLIPAEVRAIAWRPVAERALPAALLVAAAVATTVVVARVYGPSYEAGVGGIPFVDAAGGALAIYLAGLAITALIRDDERYREPIAALGLVVTTWAIGRTLDGVAVVIGWSILLVAGFALWRGLRTLATAPRWLIRRSVGIDWTADLLLPAVALAVACLAAMHLMLIELPIFDLGAATLPVVPFTDAGTVGAVSLGLASLAAGVIVGRRPALRASIMTAGAIVAYLAPFQVAPWAVVVLWSGLGVGSTVLARRDPDGRAVFPGASLLVAGAAAALAVSEVAPPSRLVVASSPVDGAVAVQSLLALAAITLALVAIARAARPHRWARWIGVLAGAVFVYLASVGVVDVAAIQVGGSVPVVELRTWGQVGLSVLWAVLGLAAFVGGLRSGYAELRHAGLGLFALATLKVFLFDLGALDVAYRVVSLIGLGLLLLAGAGLWQRHQPRPESVVPTSPVAANGESPS
jgi:uncharacterized membrane protein